MGAIDPPASSCDPPRGAGAASPLRLLIPFQKERGEDKYVDALSLKGFLERSGHEVLAVDAALAGIERIGTEVILEADGQRHPLTGFQGALLRVAGRRAQEWGGLLESQGVWVYQGAAVLAACADKGASHEVFERAGLPTPRTLVVPFTRPFDLAAATAFLASLGPAPWVVKKAHGWAGNGVIMLNDRAQALRCAAAWHQEAIARGRGGVLLQEFIETSSPRHWDLRIHTVVGVDAQGEPVASILSAAARLGQPGELITNIGRGADAVRFGLSEAEARRYWGGSVGMAEADLRRGLESGTIPFLSPELRGLALRTALTFGPGELGLDLIVAARDGKPRVLEVNPFASSKADYESQGFELYRPWAEAFAGWVAWNAARRHAR